jgi:hypothetical protein
MLNIKVIVSDTILELLETGNSAPRSVNLRPPGNAWFHAIALSIVRHDLTIDMVNTMQILGVWPRTDQRHIASEHIPKLRQFIKARSAEKPTKMRAPSIIPVGLAMPPASVWRFAHSAKLQNSEISAAPSLPRLFEDNRTLACQPYHESNRQHKWSQK